MLKRGKDDFSKNTLTLMTGSALAQALSLAVSPILTRLYTPEDFGTFALFVAVTGVFSVVACGRYEVAVLLPASDEEALHLVALAGLLLTMVTLMVLLAVWLFADYVTLFVPLNGWLYWVPVALFFTGMFNLLSSYSNRRKRYSMMAQATVFKAVVLTMVQVGIGILKGGALGLIGGQIAAAAAGNLRLIGLVAAQRKGWRAFSFSRMRRVGVSYSDFPKFQVPHTFLNTFGSQMPVYVFGTFFAASVVGLYALSARVVLAPMMIVSGSAAKVFNEKAAVLYNESGDLHALTARLLVGVAKKTLIPFIFFVMYAPEIFAFVFGVPWREAGVYTQILSPWLFMVFIVSTVSFLPALYGRQRKALGIEVVYTFLRLAALGTGIVLADVHTALALFSAVGVAVLVYNLRWILRLTKGEA